MFTVCEFEILTTFFATDLIFDLMCIIKNIADIFFALNIQRNCFPSADLSVYT